MVKSTRNYSLHIVFLCSLFLLGDTLVDIPLKGADDKTLICFLISIAITFLLIAISFKISNFILNIRRNKLYYKFVSVVFSFLVLCVAGESFARFTVFARNVIIPEINEFIIAGLFLITAYILIKANEKILLKYSLVSFIGVFAIIALFFILSLSEFKIDNVLVYYLPSVRQIYKEIIPYITRISLPVCVVPLYLKVTFERDYKKEVFLGTAVGYLLSSIVIVNSILIFGAELAGKFDYPYSAAISTVSVGYLFSRMDGFSYFLGFCCTLIRVCVCITTVKRLMFRSLLDRRILLSYN